MYDLWDLSGRFEGALSTARPDVDGFSALFYDGKVIEIKDFPCAIEVIRNKY